jgi:hypothetical protein
MEYTISLWRGWIAMGTLAITMTTNVFQYRYTQLPILTPPQRKPLSDAVIDKIVDAHTTDDDGYDIWCNGQGVARDIEAAHGIKE